jgi:hypothetical protein
MKTLIILGILAYSILWARTYMRVMSMPNSKPHSIWGIITVFLVSSLWPLLEALRYYFIQLSKAEREKADLLEKSKSIPKEEESK